QRATLVDRVEAQDGPHRGALPGSVGADEPGDGARSDSERHPVQRPGRTETLVQPVDFDRGFHAQKAREAAGGSRHALQPSFAWLAGGMAAAAHPPHEGHAGPDLWGRMSPGVQGTIRRVTRRPILSDPRMPVVSGVLLATVAVGEAIAHA